MQQKKTYVIPLVWYCKFEDVDLLMSSVNGNDNDISDCWGVGTFKEE